MIQQTIVSEMKKRIDAEIARGGVELDGQRNSKENNM